uniref:(northern house mosquito) hypothetical protein n=1 Tax=Culex pipiens TaxID=7175 RepID=A0A8D8CZJ2_CULPI
MEGIRCGVSRNGNFFACNPRIKPRQYFDVVIKTLVWWNHRFMVVEGNLCLWLTNLSRNARVCCLTWQSVGWNILMQLVSYWIGRDWNFLAGDPRVEPSQLFHVIFIGWIVWVRVRIWVVKFIVWQDFLG